MSDALGNLRDDALGGAMRTWGEANRGLRWAVWFNVGLLVFAACAMPFDHRRILGLDPWVKPMKFDFSVIVFLFTVAVLLRLLGERWRRLRGLIGWAVAASMVVENTIISMQSLRGVRSHMNYSTVLDASLFAVMGQFIALNTAAVAVLFLIWCISRPQGVPRALQWGIRLGLFAFLCGSLEGALMVMHSAHTVGAPDGGPGLAFVNWSTGHGDLRIAHFFALHALQASMLLGWWLSRTRLPEWGRLSALCTAYAGYLAAVWLLFRQAMAGRPLLG